MKYGNAPVELFLNERNTLPLWEVLGLPTYAKKDSTT